MEWKELFPSEKQPTMTEIEEYIGGDAKLLWKTLMDYMNDAYKAKPKLTYSICSGKPGWNIKFQKGGQSFGTLYPEEGAFSVFMVISYKLHEKMVDVLPDLSTKMADIYKQAGDYMKIGKWFMFQIRTREDLEDYKTLVTAKLPPKYTK
ncbi:DUF3788 domain-containing protein [Mobilitalea sibirica]|uniref:DUF3788 domain-containing protein n=1 Tax=Mobilitalea sibirica TaxID=1462919 RepID=A0A8J7GXT9_9FIRM|nr:DUF3788 domain-containing protein [Mobilitalea sibirica]MBH1940119.1 DUF3788 domain-containing protein [Mobilitalea sibirica]